MKSNLIKRRSFVTTSGLTVAGAALLPSRLALGSEANSKIEIGVIGCGGRGKWIANLFAKDGNYKLVAVADYFQDRVDEAGKNFGVPERSRFTGLNGYRKLLEQKLDAVVIQSPPYFHP